MESRINFQTNDFPSSVKDIIIEAICLHKDYLKIAKHIKEACDEKYGSPHHAIVGRNFSGYATQELSMECNIDDLKICVYKSPRWATSN